MTIDPGFLDELERYARARKQNVASELQGEQRSEDRGEGLLFADYRRYSPGDDTRRIDWKLFARTDELYVKEFEVERSLTVHVLLDASGSMDFASEDRPTKFEVGAKLGLGFAYLTAKEHNDFRFSRFEQRHERLDRGRSNRGEVLALIDQLNRAEPAGDADFEQALSEYAGTIGSRSLVLVVSDCLESPDEIERGLQALARNDVILARLIDPAERDLPVSGDVIVEGMESDRRLRTHVGARRRSTYRDRLDDHVETVAERARTLRVRHELVDTGSDFFDAFGRLWIR
ncbi:MAG: DUF58 domain-containing protein [Salinirussus sp.]